jgi:peptide chain release factor
VTQLHQFIAEISQKFNYTKTITGVYINSKYKKSDKRHPYPMKLFNTNTPKDNALTSKLKSLNILDKDISESFIHSGGKGGQNVNKVATCVQLIHIPTGIIIKCSRTRQQGLNRYWAYVLLAQKIESLATAKKLKKQHLSEKERRTHRKRSKRSKQRMLDDKKHQSHKKAQRRDVV